MQNLTFSQCFKGAWHDAAQAIVKMPILTLILFLLCLAVFFDADQQLVLMDKTANLGAHAAADAADTPATFGPFLTIAWLVMIFVTKARVIRMCVQGEAQRPFFAGVNRLVLLNLIYVACFTAVATSIVAAYLALSGHQGGAAATAHATEPTVVIGVIVGLVILIGWFLVTRLILMTPHVVMGGRFAWRKAWHDTRGHFWSTLGTLLGTLSPIFIVYMAIAFGRQYLSLQADTNSLLYDSALFLSALCCLIYMIVASAAYAWLYKRYADALVQQP